MEPPLQQQQQSVDLVGGGDVDDASSTSSSFDYIVVGAGSSCMGFLAGLLLQQQQADFAALTVAVVERGGDDDDDDDSIENVNNEVAHWYQDSHHEHNNSNTKLLTASCWGRQLRVPTGSGVGGTSRIHASLCLSPDADDDLDACWPEPCRSQLKKSLDCIQQLLDENQALHEFHHGADHHTHHSVQYSSNSNKKKKKNDDHDDDDHDPSNTKPHIRTRSIPCRCTVTKGGKYRMNYYKAIVAPLLLHHDAAAHKRRGGGGQQTKAIIQWFTHCVVQNLVVEPSSSSSSSSQNNNDNLGSVVKGVKLWNEATQTHQTLYAKRKVILSAGVFGSPAILMASGLLSNRPRSSRSSSSSSPSRHEPAATCHKEDEEEDNDENWIDLPLMDHVMIPCAMFSWRPLVSQRQLSWNGVQCLHKVDYYDPGNNNDNKNKKRFLVARMDATVYADILPSVLVDLLLIRRESWPVLARLLEGVARWAILWTPLGWILRYHVITMAIFCMNPNMTGNKLSLRKRRNFKTTVVSEKRHSSSTDVEVKIHLPYLKDEQDIFALRTVWEDCKKLVAPPSAIEFFPSALIRRGPFGFFRAYCRAVCLPFFHWCGTLPLGGSLVDRHFGFRHVQSLCICDASVFPLQISVPPALTCAALGHALASLLMRQEKGDGDDKE